MRDICTDTAQKIKFSIKDFFCKCHQIRSFLQILSHLQEKFLMKNFICGAVGIFSWLAVADPEADTFYFLDKHFCSLKTLTFIWLTQLQFTG